MNSIGYTTTKPEPPTEVERLSKLLADEQAKVSMLQQQNEAMEAAILAIGMRQAIQRIH